MRKMMNECIVATVIESKKSNNVENDNGMEDWMDKNDYDLLCFWENVMCKRAKMFKLCSVRSFLTKVFTIVRNFSFQIHTHISSIN